jgi:hypothetical protein
MADRDGDRDPRCALVNSRTTPFREKCWCRYEPETIFATANLVAVAGCCCS